LREILDYRTEDFRLTLNGSIGSNNKLFYTCTFVSNAERFSFTDESYAQVCCDVFARIKTSGKIVAINDDDFECCEQDIEYVDFEENGSGATVKLKNGKFKKINLNTVLIKTECFNEKHFETKLKDLEKALKQISGQIQQVA
jgi:hypothetical protein